ncbi:hypothetical protein GQA70_19685 (plasmid) [Ponticoccus alexandrii]|uniref:Thiolase C-terminal domain-containing protein n=1 Tax=Ponticoccus alexandrii TaxID=1943633 RepID=A0ABX7FEE6_9RHOB|nr:hypothetical protein GQA70_19685 [Ponticoccus alexandrii]
MDGRVQITLKQREGISRETIETRRLLHRKPEAQSSQDEPDPLLDPVVICPKTADDGQAALRDLGIADDDPRMDPNGGAIALGYPVGMSEARMTGTAMLELKPGEKSLFMM